MGKNDEIIATSWEIRANIYDNLKFIYERHC